MIQTEFIRPNKKWKLIMHGPYSNVFERKLISIEYEFIITISTQSMFWICFELTNRITKKTSNRCYQEIQIPKRQELKNMARHTFECLRIINDSN